MSQSITTLGAVDRRPALNELRRNLYSPARALGDLAQGANEHLRRQLMCGELCILLSSSSWVFFAWVGFALSDRSRVHMPHSDVIVCRDSTRIVTDDD